MDNESPPLLPAETESTRLERKFEEAQKGLLEAGRRESENGIVLQNGLVVGTQEDNEAVKGAFEKVVQAALESGKFKVVPFDGFEDKK